MCVCVCVRYHSPDLIGVVRVKLSEADLFGETAHRIIEPSTVDVSKVYMSLCVVMSSIT